MREREMNDIMELGHVIRIEPDCSITDSVPGVYAPELLMSVHDGGQILADDERDYIDQAERQGWSLERGWTNQERYAGVVMHASEYIGGGLEDHIRETPGLWVAISVETDDSDENAAGWALAYRAETPCDECGEMIPEVASDMVNRWHAKSCSLHPDNTVT
jgi:hypothetical protein